MILLLLLCSKIFRNHRCLGWSRFLATTNMRGRGWSWTSRESREPKCPTYQNCLKFHDGPRCDSNLDRCLRFLVRVERLGNSSWSHFFFRSNNSLRQRTLSGPPCYFRACNERRCLQNHRRTRFGKTFHKNFRTKYRVGCHRHTNTNRELSTFPTSCRCSLNVRTSRAKTVSKWCVVLAKMDHDLQVLGALQHRTFHRATCRISPYLDDIQPDSTGRSYPGSRNWSKSAEVARAEVDRAEVVVGLVVWAEVTRG